VGSGCDCEDASDDVELRAAVSDEGIKVNGLVGHLDTRTADEAFERLRDFGAGV